MPVPNEKTLKDSPGIGEDQEIFMRQVEDCLDDTRIRGYFTAGLVQRDHVLALLARGSAFEQAKSKDSYQRYAALREGAPSEGRRERARYGTTNLGVLTAVIAALIVALTLVEIVFASSVVILLVLLSTMISSSVGFILARASNSHKKSGQIAAALIILAVAITISVFSNHLTQPPGILILPYALLGITLADAYLLMSLRTRLDRRRIAGTSSRNYIWKTEANPSVGELRNRWMIDIVETVIMPNLVLAINTLLGNEQDKLLVEPESEGLKRLQDPIFRVSTRSADRLKNMLSQMEGGSIALAGPRGVGKSTLLKLRSQLPGDQMISIHGISIYVPAPAEYIAKEFIADLFQRLCEAYLQYSRSTASASLPGKHIQGMGHARYFRKVFALSWLVIRALFAVAVVAWVALAVLKNAFPGLLPSTSTLGHWTEHAQDLIRIWWLNDRRYFLIAAVLVALACWPSLRVWRRNIRMRNESELTRRARECLLRLQVDKTITKSASFNPSVRGMAAFALNRGTSVKYVPWTMPELVGQARRFIEDVFSELRTVNRTIFIGIDEIDRIGSVEHTERFIGEIKAIFGIEGCFFLVAVAEDVGSLFAQRATAGRSILENAFDEIVTVRPLDLVEARYLLLRRVPGFTDSFVYLVHALSGGLPRELIRVSRRLVEINLEREKVAGYPRLDYLAQALVEEAVVEVLDAARNQMSHLVLGPAWAAPFDAMRLASVALMRDNSSSRESYLTIETLSQVHIGGEYSTGDEHVAGRILDRLSAFAYFGITIIDAFADKYFNLEEVRVKTAVGSPNSYEELAAARIELSVSAASSRIMLHRFRESLVGG